MPMPWPQPCPFSVNNVAACAGAPPSAETASPSVAQMMEIVRFMSIRPRPPVRPYQCSTTGYSRRGVASITCRNVMNPIALLPAPLRTAAEILLTLVMAVVIAYVAQAFLVKPYRVPTSSMAPTLQPGDRVIADRVSLHFRDPARGEIVVFHPPF